MGIINEFEVEIGGNGNVVESANGTLITCEADDSTSNRGALYRGFVAYPGVTYTMVVNAKKTSEGSSLPPPFLAVDYPLTGSLVSKVELTDSTEQYLVKYTVPYNANPNTDKVFFALGVFGSTSGGVEISGVSFHTDKTITEMEEVRSDQPVYLAITGELEPNATLDCKISRVGNQVIIAGTLHVTSTASSGSFDFGDTFLPTWAIPLQKTTLFNSFSTGGNWFTSTDVNTLDDVASKRWLRHYSREVGSSGITDMPFTTGDYPLMISYLCES